MVEWIYWEAFKKEEEEKCNVLIFWKVCTQKRFRLIYTADIIIKDSYLLNRTETITGHETTNISHCSKSHGPIILFASDP